MCVVAHSSIVCALISLVQDLSQLEWVALGTEVCCNKVKRFTKNLKLASASLITLDLEAE